MPEAAQNTTTGQSNDPLRSYNWKVLIGGQLVGSFIQCSGLDVVVDAIDYYEGGSPYARKIPGRAHYAPITLEYGLTTDTAMWDWMKASVAQKQLAGPGQYGPDRKDVSIVMTNPDGSKILQWNLHQAWPSRWRGKPLDAASSQIAIVVLELSFDYADQD
jgi:phage tail-like protein